MSAAPSPASPAEALAMLRSAMGYLAAADATALATETQAQCLLALEQLDAIETAARASMLAAFTAGQGYAADADYSPRAWLMYKTRVTKGAASGHLGWVGRAAAHPQVIAALAEGHILSESVARRICQWTDKLPGDCRLAADAILIVAAKSGADLRGLAELAAEIYARSLPDDPDDGPDDGFDDRSVRLETTFDGAGVLAGDLTPQCAAVVTAVLDALSAPAGAGDTRTYGQRYHDALQEAMRRLVASDLLPERAGQPVKVVAHIALADLLLMEGSSALQEEWIASARAAWVAARAGASVGGSDGAAWLDSDAAQAVACDASVTPVVTGDVNPAALDDLVRLCVELDRLRHRHGPAQAEPEADTARAWEALEQAVIGQAVDLFGSGQARVVPPAQAAGRWSRPGNPGVWSAQSWPFSVRLAGQDLGLDRHRAPVRPDRFEGEPGADGDLSGGFGEQRVPARVRGQVGQRRPDPFLAGVHLDSRGHGLHRWPAPGGLLVASCWSTSALISSRVADHRPGGRPWPMPG